MLATIGSATAVRRPATTRERLLTAPVRGSSSVALAVPMTCPAVPKATPRATLSVRRNSLHREGPRTLAEMPVTMLRVNLVAGLGPVLQIAEGYTCVLEKDMHDLLEQRTNPTWPTTWFAPRLTGEGAFRDVYSVMANWGANHGCFTYGHIGKDLITLASMLRIPVAMHNVPDKDVYRPHVWAAFGTKDLESADYRACEVYGPLYR